METPVQLSFPLPRSIDTRIYLHLTVKSKAIVLFLTTASAEEAGTPTPLGSFVYALPDVSKGPRPLRCSASTAGNETTAPNLSLALKAIQPKPASVHAALHGGADAGVHNPPGEAAGAEDAASDLRGQLDKSREHRARGLCGGGDGGIQACRRGHLVPTAAHHRIRPGRAKRRPRRVGSSPCRAMESNCLS